MEEAQDFLGSWVHPAEPLLLPRLPNLPTVLARVVDIVKLVDIQISVAVFVHVFEDQVNLGWRFAWPEVAHHSLKVLKADLVAPLVGDQQAKGVLSSLPLVKEQPLELFPLLAGEDVVDDRQHQIHQKIEVVGQVRDEEDARRLAAKLADLDEEDTKAVTLGRPRKKILGVI